MGNKQVPLLWLPVLFLIMALCGPAAADVDYETAQAGGVAATLPRESRFLAPSDDETLSAWLNVRNPGDKARQLNLELLLRSPDDTETAHDYEVGLPPGAKERVFLPPERLNLNGIYTIRFRLKLDEEVSEWHQDVLARYRKNAPARRGESVFPIGFASGAPRPTPWLFDVAASVGFEFQRLETRWPQVQPNADTWNWHVIDSTIDLMEEKGIRFLPLALGSARWAAGGYLEPPELGAWRRWLTALADRYQGRAEFWEIWNEPDIGFFRGTVEDYVERPIVFTETGMDTRHGQRHQAETLMKTMSYASALGAKAYTWYNLMDRAGGEQSNRPGHTYGLLTNPTGTGNFAEIEDRIRPKEALVAAAAAVRELRGRPHLERWAEDGRRFAFLFGKPGDHLLVNWLEDERTPEPIWIVAGSMERASRLDLFGNSSPVPVVEGGALVSLGEPRYYRFEGGETAPRLLQPLVVAPDRVSPGPDGEVLLELQVRNPLDRQMKVHAEVNAAEFTVLDPPRARTIDPAGTVKLPIRLAAGGGRFGEVQAFEIQFRFEGLPWIPSMRVPVSFNTIQAGDGYRLRLNDLANANNKHEHDPHTVHLLWSGAADLSIEADLSADSGDRALKLSLVVTDNQHHPAPEGASILDGDALEVGWATAGGATGRLEIAGDPGASHFDPADFPILRVDD